MHRALPRADATASTPPYGRNRARARARVRAGQHHTAPPAAYRRVYTNPHAHTRGSASCCAATGARRGNWGGGVLTVGLHLDPHQVQHGTASHASLVSNVQTSGPGGGSACGRAGTATATATHTAARRSKRTIFAPPNLKIISDIAGFPILNFPIMAKSSLVGSMILFYPNISRSLNDKTIKVVKSVRTVNFFTFFSSRFRKVALQLVPAGESQRQGAGRGVQGRVSVASFTCYN